MARYQAKTVKTGASVDAFLANVEHPIRRADGMALDAVFRQATGWSPRMWGPSMVGYGSYAYTYKTGHSGVSLATGFAPRKSNLSIYIMPGYAEFGDLLARLGKHKHGKACLYVNKLADIDLEVLRELITTGLDRLGGIYPVEPS
ncbi:MAG: DUF1801 domain-containing protein [Pseudomonadota bacterium]